MYVADELLLRSSYGSVFMRMQEVEVDCEALQVEQIFFTFE